MKKLISAFVVVTVSLVSGSAWAAHSCQRYAEVVALDAMEKQLIEERKPDELSDEEKPSLGQSFPSDASGEESSSDRGIYVVEMGVMEECLAAMLVKTQVVRDARGLESCKVVSVESIGDMDCG